MNLTGEKKFFPEKSDEVKMSKAEIIMMVENAGFEAVYRYLLIFQKLIVLDFSSRA